MPGVGIIRVKKYTVGALGGIGRHNERVSAEEVVESESVMDGAGEEVPVGKVCRSNPNIIPERTKHNYHLRECLDKSYETAFKLVCAKNGVDLKKSHIRTQGDKSKQSKVMFEILVVSPWAFPGEYKKYVDMTEAEKKDHWAYMNEDRHRKFFKAALESLAEKYGEKKIVSAVVHMDEGRPHMHVEFVPIVTGTSSKTNKRSGSVKQTEVKKVRMSDVWKGFNSYGLLQDWFHGEMVSKGFDIERGLRADPLNPKYLPDFKEFVSAKDELNRLLAVEFTPTKILHKGKVLVDEKEARYFFERVKEFIKTLPDVRGLRALRGAMRKKDKDLEEVARELQKLERAIEAQERDVRTREDEVQKAAKEAEEAQRKADEQTRKADAAIANAVPIARMQIEGEYDEREEAVRKREEEAKRKEEQNKIDAERVKERGAELDREKMDVKFREGAVTGFENAAKEREKRLDERSAELDARERRINTKDSTLTDRETKVAEREENAAQIEQNLKGREDAVGLRETKADRKERDNTQRGAELETKEKNLGGREEKANEILGREADVAAKDASLTEREGRINEEVANVNAYAKDVVGYAAAVEKLEGRLERSAKALTALRTVFQTVWSFLTGEAKRREDRVAGREETFMQKVAVLVEDKKAVDAHKAKWGTVEALNGVLRTMMATLEEMAAGIVLKGMRIGLTNEGIRAVAKIVNPLAEQVAKANKDSGGGPIPPLSVERIVARAKEKEREMPGP